MYDPRSKESVPDRTRPASSQAGFNMIELMVALAIVALVMMFGVPSVSSWLRSSQIRNAAESIQNGLQLTRAEAVRRNTSVQFVFPSLAGGSDGSDWTVTCVTPSATCPGAGQTETEIQKRGAKEGSPSVQVTSANSTIVYNGMGRVTPAPAADISVDVKNSSGGACAKDGGPMRCLRIVVSQGGHIKMCDPALPSTNPRGC
jgi:type IV fimbrial biogenesis protein FimT